LRVSKQQIREDIKGLAGLLAPFGITSSEQLAALLRQDDGYPSGAYIRLMLSPWDEPDPSERFCDRFYLLKEYVERSLVGDHADLLVTLDRVIIRDGYDPSRKIRFVVSSDGHFKFNEVVMVREEAGVPEGALVYVPPDFIGQCQECGTVFFKRSSSARYCKPVCRREARKRRRRILMMLESEA
jgi:hypothetical protein